MNAGTRLGPYEVISRIGAGGMGEVWRANDTRLGRSVAVKVLPAEFGANSQLRTRFEREARTISQLNHPHICTLFDVGEDYLVMELLEGESLAERLSRGPLAISEVLRYGTQIADALDKAHRQGVVHRDLKPGNVMITRSGAKLLDFGLAKSAVLELSPDGATEHRPLTQEGTILGTFQYMSPEQLEGLNVDARSDIFALGALLYEMLTARRAFEGKTKTSLIAAIVSADPPPLAQLQPLAPPALDHVIRKCLAKDPEERWQSAHDIAEELRWIGEAGSQAGVAAATAASRRVRRSTIIAAAIVGWLLAIASGAFVWNLRKRIMIAERPMQAEFAAPEGVRISGVVQGPAALSPDGRQVVFAASESSGLVLLYLRDVSDGSTRAIEGTSGCVFPFWSPDNTSIGFFADNKLKITSVGGGGVQELANAPAGRGGAWSPNGTIIFSPDIASGLMRVTVGGGVAQPLTRITSPQESHRNPWFLSDGERFLYTRRTGTMAAADVYAGSLSGNVHKRVLEKASNVAVGGGYLLFARDGNLVGQRFDEKNLAVQGAPVVLARGVEYYNPRDVANFTVSGDGVLLYRGKAALTAQPMWYDADGKPIGPVGSPGIYRGATISADGRKIVFIKDDGSGRGDLWITDITRGTTTRATFVNAGLINGVMSPDGTRLAVSTSFLGKTPTVWTQSVTGGGARQEIYRAEDSFVVTSWSSDGRTIYGMLQRNSTGFDVAAMDASTGKVHVLLANPYDEMTPAVSGDGKWLAYQSNESGRPQVYVVSIDDPAVKWQISVEGGGVPVWSTDDTRITFGTSGPAGAGAGPLYSVAVRKSKDGLDFDAPRKLPFDLENATGRAVAADGHAVITQGKPVTTPFHVITNWTRAIHE